MLTTVKSCLSGFGQEWLCHRLLLRTGSLGQGTGSQVVPILASPEPPSWKLDHFGHYNDSEDSPETSDTQCDHAHLMQALQDLRKLYVNAQWTQRPLVRTLNWRGQLCLRRVRRAPWLLWHASQLLSVVTEIQRGCRCKALCRLGWGDKQAKCRQCQLVASSNYDILTSRQSWKIKKLLSFESNLEKIENILNF